MIYIEPSILPAPPFSPSIQPLDTASTLPASRDDSTSTSKGLRKLFCAAVVSNEFCQRLLNMPAQALDAGYNGERFDLSPRERAAVLSLHASSLSDFAHQLLQELEQSPTSQENSAYHDTVYRVTQSRG